MTTDARNRVARQRTEDLTRLAAQAERNGVRIMRTRDGEQFATSASDPHFLYRVSPTGCECLGYYAHGRCQHNSLLLAELGLIDDTDASEDDCPTCGAPKIGGYREGSRICPYCDYPEGDATPSVEPTPPHPWSDHTDQPYAAD